MSGPTAAMLAAMDGNPRTNVPTRITRLAEQWQRVAFGRPNATRYVAPFEPHDKASLKTLVLDLTDKVAALAYESGSLAERERYVRYWMVWCGLLGEAYVIRSIEQIWLLNGFAAVLGVVWVPRGHVRGDQLGLNHGTVRGAVSQITAWHFEMHGIDLKLYGSRCSKVVRGLKKMAGPTLPLLHLSFDALKFIVGWLQRTGTPESIATAHAIMWLFFALFRVSEIASTDAHNLSGGTARYLLDTNVTITRATHIDGPTTRGATSSARVRLISWTLPKTKWKDQQMNRHLFASGCQAEEANDVLLTDLTNDFANVMAKQKVLNAQYLQQHPTKAASLPFIHVNGEALTRGTIQRAIVDGLRAGHASHSLPNPDEYRVGTHTGRRGGATYYSENGAGDKFLCWLGRWASVAWLHYVQVTSRAVCRVSGLLKW